MVNYLISTANQSAICLRKDQFKNLMDQLESLRAISALNMNKSMPEIAKIKSLISDYKTQQDYFISRLKNWGVAELSREETFHADASYGKVPDRLSINQTWSEMLAADYDKILSDIESTRPVTKDPKKLAQLRASTELYTKVRARQQEILRKYPKLVDYKKRINQQLADSEAASTAAGQIALEERKLYDAMYSNLKDSNKQGSNPCKDFIL
jgi:hypothetical protein